MIETRPLGRSGSRVGVIGICPGQGPQRDSIVERARALGCTLVGDGAHPTGAGIVRYNLLDQKKANDEISALSRSGKGVLAVHVLAGGVLAGRKDHSYGHRVEALQVLVKPGRSLVQAAVQFVLANESVSAAMVRVSSLAHLDEVVSALDAVPLTGQDLEQIFELWANRFE
ncbi:MAG TPA: aldo/keto reductase [Planctomycetota bacterium]|nr:aldo/keto reductase [Planctomycetota bacterium]